ncbi:alkaline shock response membrane anchor protein AmaP [bacterium]|nr:MAG: alkaline shock response membrane anchor protein AmaP [bacterium]
MRVLTVLFYAGFLILVGVVLISFALMLSYGFVKIENVDSLFVYLQNSFSARLILAISGVLLIVISLSFARIILGRFHREKTMSFKTSSGEVTVSLYVVEDLIRRLTDVLPEIRDLKPDVIATKKGILVNLRVVLNWEVNIHELTEQLQETIKSKIREVLGSDEEIIIRINIAKIISREEKEKNKKNLGKDEPNVPFGSYGRI